MRVRTILCLITAFAWLLSTDAITVSPGKNVTEGNCTGPLEYFLCNCMALNATIDIHLSPGQYNFSYQPFCVLQNQSSIKLIGNISQSNDTVSIKCQVPFNIVFMRVQNVIISNITLVKCGKVMNDSTNQTIYNTTNKFSLWLWVQFCYYVLSR